MKPRYQQYKVISILIKTVMISLSAGYIFFRLGPGDLEASVSYLQANLFNEYGAILITGIVAMMLINWLTEAKKWQLLTAHIQPISIAASLKSILSGLTVALFTPNRTGEFIGRVLHLHQANRIKGTLASFTGSFAQSVTTISFGVAGLICYLLRYPQGQSAGSQPVLLAIIVLSGAFAILLIIFYLYSRLFVRLLWNVRFLRKARKYIIIFNSYRPAFLLRILLLSSFRYLIFTLQFYLLLYATGVSLSLAAGCCLISLTFLLTTTLPSFAFSEIFTRGSASILVFSVTGAAPSAVAAASFLLWFVNLAIPALAGAFTILNVKIFRSIKK